ncbi:hypothetical protein FJZ53_04910 [Candidatus Woesearchaeota archaeon]|nr:hypothetical protein [Candidatus Woesearchaeota archaeon]
MIWVFAPLVATLVLMELYSDYYKAEELGWNTAFGNNLVLIFVSLDLLRFLYNKGELGYATLESALVIAVAILGVTLTVIDFFHSLPKDLAFGMSSHFPVNIIACLTIIIIYSGIKIDIYTGVAAVVISVIVYTILKIVNWIIPDSGEIPELENIGEEKK